MKKNLFLLLFVFCLHVLPVRAEIVENDFYTIDMPDSWQTLQSDSSPTFNIYVYATKSRDAVITVVIAASGGASLETITNSFAQQYKAKGRVKNKLGSFTFRDANETSGTGYVTVQDNLYMVLTVNGNLPKARAFIKNFSSEKYRDLIPAI